MKIERWVVDTNVLISATLLPDSVPAKVLQRVLARHRLVFSSATFDELQTRLWRPKFDRYVSVEIRRSLLHDLAAVADWVEPDEALAAQRFSRDQDDDPIIHTAVTAQAAVIVTGDADLLTLSQVQGTRIISPAQALMPG